MKCLKILILIALVLPSKMSLAEKKLSQLAWESCALTYKKILEHPFIRELASGVLDKKKFCFYMKQDAEYLLADGRSFALLAGRVSDPAISTTLLALSKGSFVSEQQTVHDYFFKTLCSNHTSEEPTPALFAYSNFLLAQSILAEPGAAMGALLPCLWIYHEVGKFLLKTAKVNNPYQHWINAYSDPEFDKDLQAAIGIFDSFAQSASVAEKERMVQAFKTSCVLELNFWADAYDLKHF